LISGLNRELQAFGGWHSRKISLVWQVLAALQVSREILKMESYIDYLRHLLQYRHQGNRLAAKDGKTVKMRKIVTLW